MDSQDIKGMVFAMRFREGLEQLDAEERLAVKDLLFGDMCDHCGEFNNPCYCMNDE